MSFSSFKKDKLIFENWRGFVAEQEEEDPEAGGTAGGITTSDAYTMSLPQFASALQSNRKDFIAAVLNGLKDGKAEDDVLNIEPATVNVVDLRPTQSEVVFDKSIKFALQKPDVFMDYFTSNGPHKVGPKDNNAIITLNKKFILDGHHRWSSLYCVNPKAAMHTFDIKANINPINVLKLMQASITAHAGKIMSAAGGGINLFTIDEKTLTNEVRKLLTGDLLRQYKQLGLFEADPDATGQGMFKILLSIYQRNVGLMQKNNRPAKNAGTRETMPQTDLDGAIPVVAGSATPATLTPLEKGKVDFRGPHAVKKAAR